MALDMDEIVGDSQFHKSVMYCYNDRTRYGSSNGYIPESGST